MQIHLRPVSDADLLCFFDHARDEAAIRMAVPASLVATWPAFERKWFDILANDAFLCRTVVSDGRVAGYVAKFMQKQLPSLSYWFGRPFWGQRLARRALRQLLAQVDERPLYARVASSNGASLRVLEVNGFLPAGTDSYFSHVRGRDMDEIVMRLDD